MAKDLATLRAQRATYSVTYFATHPEQVLKKRARSAAYYAANREKILTYQAAKHAKNPEKERARQAAKRMAHPDKERARQSKWAIAHPEKISAKNARRRAHKKYVSLNDFTAAQWEEIQVVYNHRCVYCGKRAKGHLTQDHITPLSKGGNHTASNIVPACRSCNSKKCTGHPPVPVQPLLLTVAPSKKTVK